MYERTQHPPRAATGSTPATDLRPITTSSNAPAVATQIQRASGLGHRLAASSSTAPVQRTRTSLGEVEELTKDGGTLVKPGPLNRLGFLNPRRYLPTAVGGYTQTQMREPQNTNVRGPLTLLGSANPRRHLPTAIGGYTREQMQEPHNADQAGLLNTLGIANPRRYLPTMLGGYTREQMREPHNANVAGPLTRLGTANPRRYLPTLLGGYSAEQMQQQPNRQTWGPLSYLGPANPRRYLPTLLGGYTPEQMQQRHNGGTGHVFDMYAWSHASDDGTHHMTFARNWQHPDRVEDFRQNGLAKIGPEVEATADSGEKQPSRQFNRLLVGEHTRKQHIARLQNRKRLQSDKRDGPRHNQVFHLRVPLTDEERDAIDHHVDTANSYHFYSEARDQPPPWGSNVARCMSPLEVLAKTRGQAHKLPVADPGPMLSAFYAMNRDSEMQVARYPRPDEPDEYWNDLQGRKPEPPK